MPLLLADGKEFSTFFAKQVKIVRANGGIIDPESIEDYIAAGGYQALHQALTEMKPAEIVEADPKTDPAGFEQLRTAVTRSIGGDLATVFADALRARAQPRINQAALDNITGQPQ